MMDCFMGNAISADVLILTLCILTGGHTCHGSVYNIMEGETANLSCVVDADDDVWSISWVMFKINDTIDEYEEVIVTCYIDRWEDTCVNRSGQIKYQKTIRYKQHTSEYNSSFVSQLMLMNVSIQMKITNIKCVILLIDYNIDSEDVTGVLRQPVAYDLHVYKLPKVDKCAAVLDNESLIKISCEFSYAYPQITCDIFPEFDNGIITLITESHPTSRPMPDWTSTEQSYGNNSYYNASCSRSYYPRETGSYRFRAEVYEIGNGISRMNVTTNLVTVDCIQTKCLVHEASQLDANKNVETTTAFYTLIAAVMSLVTIIILAIGWVIWSQHTKASDTHSEPSHYYEAVGNEIDRCSVMNINEPGGCSDSRVVAHASCTFYNNEDQVINNSHKHVLGNYNNHNITDASCYCTDNFNDDSTWNSTDTPFHYADIPNSDDNQNITDTTPYSTGISNNEYIIPCTPSPTLRRCSVNTAAVGLYSDEEPDSSF